MDLRQKKASASRAFDLSNVLHQLTEAQQRFQVTHQITEPAVKRAARKWKRMAQIRIKEVSHRLSDGQGRPETRDRQYRSSVEL